jgi:hypothetical protein
MNEMSLKCHPMNEMSLSLDGMNVTLSLYEMSLESLNVTM